MSAAGWQRESALGAGTGETPHPFPRPKRGNSWWLKRTGANVGVASSLSRLSLASLNLKIMLLTLNHFRFGTARVFHIQSVVLINHNRFAFVARFLNTDYYRRDFYLITLSCMAKSSLASI